MDHQLRKHSDSKNFACSQCDRAYSTKYQLTDHVRVSHANSKLRCSVCSYTSTNFLAIKKHIISMHTHPNLKPYQCFYCTFTHVHSGCIYAHCKRLHKESVPKFKLIMDMPELTVPVYKVTATPDGEKTEVYATPWLYYKSFNVCWYYCIYIIL